MTGKQKRFLRALGHHMRPTAQLGKSRITEGLIQQIDDNLTAHELVKVKMLQVSGPERKELAAEMAAATGSELVQVLGGCVLLYRPHPDSPEIQLPKPAAKT